MTTQEYYQTSIALHPFLTDGKGVSIVYNFDGVNRTFTTALVKDEFILYGSPTNEEIARGKQAKRFTLQEFLTSAGITL